MSDEKVSQGMTEDPGGSTREAAVPQSSQALTIQEEGLPTSVERLSMEQLRERANILLESGLMPDRWKTPEQVLAVIVAGRELGLPIMAAVSSLYPLPNGSLGSDTKTMLSIVYRSGLCEDLGWEFDDKSVRVWTKRKGYSKMEFTWGQDDDQRAGLGSKQVHRMYPRQMWLWRAVSALFRMAYPDVIQGLYGVEEFGESPLTPQYNTQPSARTAMTPKSTTSVQDVVDGEFVEVDDWIDFSAAAKALGRNVREALMFIGCKDIPEAKDKYGSPQKAFEALRDTLVEREARGHRDEVMGLVMGIYDVSEETSLPNGLLAFIDQWFDEHQGASAEDFDLTILIDEDSGLPKNWDSDTKESIAETEANGHDTEKASA